MTRDEKIASELARDDRKQNHSNFFLMVSCASEVAHALSFCIAPSRFGAALQASPAS
jgi:hypothetical protein